MNAKRFKSILPTILITGLFGYAGYAMLIQMIGVGMVVQTLGDKREVFVDNAAKTFFDPECMREWLRVRRAGPRYPIGESTVGEARRLGYRSYNCDNPA